MRHLIILHRAILIRRATWQEVSSNAKKKKIEARGVYLSATSTRAGGSCYEPGIGSAIS